MNNLIIEFADTRDLDDVVTLSKKFEQEHCCNGIVADDKEFFSGIKVAVAKIGNLIVGYCYGKIETKEKGSSLFRKGQKAFYIEELYIDKSYRNKDIGQMLFLFMEKYAKENGCDFIETTAVSKNYKSLLSFYIDKMDMEFWYAELIKKL